MSGHQHVGGPGMTQNQGNMIGDRPCVRQSRLYREQVGGNAMKELLGQDQLKWDTTRTEGAYAGGRVYDHNAPGNVAPQGQQQPQQQYSQHDYTQQSQAYGQGQGYAQQPTYAQQQQQGSGVGAAMNGHSAQAPASNPHKGRVGAGQANKSTYNILTGQ